MGAVTGIAWTDHTFNPWRGCVAVSPACAHCYAETLSKRNPAVLGEWGARGRRAIAAESYWRAPLAWNRAALRDGVRRRVFCLSLGDVFEARADLALHRARLFRLIEATSGLDWLLLTKRPAEASRLAAEAGWPGAWPANVWAGVTAEDQQRAAERIPLLLQLPARVRFVSYEPALGPVDFEDWRWPMCQQPTQEAHDRECLGGLACPEASLDWLIVGGESGPKARPFDMAWARATIAQCREAGVAVFVKQLGARPLGISTRNRAGADPAEWPEDLRVRQFPGGA